MVELIEKNIGKKAIIDFKPMQPGDVPESFADINESKRKLSYKPCVNVDKGIERFINWYNNYRKDNNS